MTSVRTESAERDIELQVANPTKRFANFVEWNVDMKVTVSSAKRSKIIQRLRNLIIFILAILFAVILSHLKREVRALQVQMHYMNVNFLVLMSRYDRLNRNFNRVWYERGSRLYRAHRAESAEDAEDAQNAPSARRPDADVAARTFLPSKVPEIFESADDGPVSAATSVLNAVVRLSESASNVRNETLPADGGESVSVDDEPSSGQKIIDSPSSGGDSVIDRSKRGSVLRSEREILTLDKGESDESVEDDDDLETWRVPRAGRVRRDEGRGKKRRKNKRRPKRSRRRLGPMVATFVGAIPEQHVTDAVHIGPWVKSARNDSQYSLNKFHLVEDKKSIEVTTSGLYMISVQIFYFGEPKNYSYWILLSSEGQSATQKLVKCATASAVSAAEVSCYTSVIALLRRGDRLHVQQQERDRLINMREGHSYIQLVLLSGNAHKRRST